MLSKAEKIAKRTIARTSGAKIGRNIDNKPIQSRKIQMRRRGQIIILLFKISNVGHVWKVTYYRKVTYELAQDLQYIEEETCVHCDPGKRGEVEHNICIR